MTNEIARLKTKLYVAESYGFSWVLQDIIDEIMKDCDWITAKELMSKLKGEYKEEIAKLEQIHGNKYRQMEIGE